MPTPQNTALPLPTDVQLRKVVGRVLDRYTRDALLAILPWIEYVMGIPVDLPNHPMLPGGSDSSAEWFVGSGVPGDLPGSKPGDLYLDRDSGNVYELS